MNAAGGFDFLAALSRRRALARLGFGVAATYAAPMVLRISEARAASGSDDGIAGSITAAHSPGAPVLPDTRRAG